MNICLTSYEYPPETFDGIGTYTRTLARALAALGNKVDVVTFTAKTPYDYIEHGAHIHRINPINLKGLWRLDRFFPSKMLEYSIAVTRKIKELGSKRPIDIIEGPESRAELIYHLTTRNGHRKPPVVIKLHTPSYILQKHNFHTLRAHQKVMSSMEIRSIKKADYLTSPSHDLKSCIAQDLRVSEEKIRVIPNPLDLKEFDIPAENRKTDTIKILYAGRMERIKGVEILAQAIPLVLKEVKNCQFTFVGADSNTTDQKTSMREFLKKYFFAQQCADQVILLDHKAKEELVKFYQASDIVVVPSFYESLGYVCLEALTCRKAVVVSASGGLNEIVTDGVSGFLVTPKDHRALADRIIRLCRNEELRRQFGEAGRKFVEQNYSIEAAAGKTLEYYESIVRMN